MNEGGEAVTVPWHERFLQQAAWTHQLRAYAFERAGLVSARRLLEVGCGTGAILADLGAPAAAMVHGLDLDPARLAEARRHAPAAALACGDALRLPYAGRVFDMTFCHFLLLWVGDPLQALREMKRVTRPGGWVLALAEPDYEGRIDEPPALAPLGRWQAEALRGQGADAGLGRRLAELFRRAGITVVETGTLTGSGGERPASEARALEWTVLEADLAGRVPPGELEALKRLDEDAWERGERRLYVPTHFTYGRV